MNMTQVISVKDEKPFPLRHYRSCAVVSNSGALSGHEYGAEIDAADAVFRFNDAPTKDFEKVVGKKETIRIVNSNVVERALHDPDYSYDGGAEQISHAVPSGPCSKFAKKFPRKPLHRVKDEILDKFTKWLLETWDPRWKDKGTHGSRDTLTTGAVGMLIALSLCDEVKAYGMAASKDMSSAPYHYYGTSGSPNAGDNVHHSMFEAEKDLWRLVSSTDTDKTSAVVATIPGFSQKICSDTDKN